MLDYRDRHPRADATRSAVTILRQALHLHLKTNHEDSGCTMSDAELETEGRRFRLDARRRVEF